MVAMTVVLTALLYIMVLGMIGGDVGTTSKIGSVKLATVDSTTLDAQFTKITPPARPMDLKIIIGYNTSEGTYSFTSNGDGELLFADGIDICDIDYTDNADDSYVSSGDYLRVSNLPSGSVVTVWVLDATTGGMIVTKTWDLPG
jgi:hypothetical protein